MPAWYTLLSAFSRVARLLSASKVCINDGKATVALPVDAGMMLI